MTEQNKTTPLPLPTVQQVVEVAKAEGHAVEEIFNTQPVSTNMGTAAGQTNVPTHVGSQPSSNKALDPQFQTPFKITSIPLDEVFLRPLTEDEILRMPGLEARSFNYSGDEVKVLPINHGYVLRWTQCGNFKNGSGTNWLAKMIARGFEYCTKSDLAPEFREKFQVDSLGHLIIPPDLVLMKCEARLYYGYLKANMMESRDRVSDKGALARAQKIAASQMKGGGELPGELSKSDIPGRNNPSPKFHNSLREDGAQFYDPLAGR